MQLDLDKEAVNLLCSNSGPGAHCSRFLQRNSNLRLTANMTGIGSEEVNRGVLEGLRVYKVRPSAETRSP